MKTKYINAQTVVLLVSGVLLVIVGSSIIMSPVEFYASNDIEIGENTSLLSELKAPAGLLLAGGIFMIIAIFLKSKRDVALRLAALIYLSYALARSTSMLFDGIPASGLILATALEAFIGLACVVVLFVGNRSSIAKVV